MPIQGSNGTELGPGCQNDHPYNPADGRRTERNLMVEPVGSISYRSLDNNGYHPYNNPGLWTVTNLVIATAPLMVLSYSSRLLLSSASQKAKNQKKTHFIP